MSSAAYADSVNVVTNGSVTPIVIGWRPLLVGTASNAAALALAASRSAMRAARSLASSVALSRSPAPTLASSCSTERSALTVASWACPLRAWYWAACSSGSWLRRWSPSRFWVVWSGRLTVRSSQSFYQ